MTGTPKFRYCLFKVSIITFMLLFIPPFILYMYYLHFTFLHTLVHILVVLNILLHFHLSLTVLLKPSITFLNQPHFFFYNYLKIKYQILPLSRHTISSTEILFISSTSLHQYLKIFRIMLLSFFPLSLRS